MNLLLLFKSNEISNFRRQILLPLPPPQSNFTLDTVWYIDILMTGHNEASGTNPVISLLFWRKRHRHLTNASNCTSTHTHTYTHTYILTHMNDLVTVLYKPTLSHQDEPLLWQEFHCTPKILKKINYRLHSHFKPLSFHINVITFTGRLFYHV